MEIEQEWKRRMKNKTRIRSTTDVVVDAPIRGLVQRVQSPRLVIVHMAPNLMKDT
ncbi:hypothetical protein KIN20_007373 [Parelaphostrongylus tenuis]|uniref:Uncharacterized protein n=1 Tax=Parelaphostrongylus tenuis TaxID=148309 RepID=A0AAD5MM57_PARTN|nr:hypothetical protein KIN20_007373 [Parelaphostrongylus tenuis]